MTAAQPQERSAVHYPAATLKRAERAVRCAPFLLPLFATMRWQGVSVKAIATTAGVANQYTRRPLSEVTAENELLWLTQVGLLRREVDGQGLTDSFRLTPLGRQFVAEWETNGFPDRPSLWDYLVNLTTRWLRLPDWLL
ncbi:MAG TPA: hypothetical protein IGS37_18490 [Synechococcales cyanobacterium M55_K2018_004]|nr:hypothetical protein [Synechococcales cyanobacterium M55_K2018_004]